MPRATRLALKFYGPRGRLYGQHKQFYGPADMHIRQYGPRGRAQVPANQMRPACKLDGARGDLYANRAIARRAAIR
eukprot:1253950-Lingulodinium_polyedra.AAC.1